MNITTKQKADIETLIKLVLETETIYNSNSNGPDSTECPLCGATGRVKYNKGHRILQEGMEDMDHEIYCAYTVASGLLSTMEELNENKEI